MDRHHTNLDDIFQIDIVNHSTTAEVDNGLNDKNTLLSEPKKDLQFIRSHSLDRNSFLNNSTASRGNVRRWSQSLVKGVKNIKNGKFTVRDRTINFMPSRLQAALLIDGQVLLSRDKEIEQLTKEIEQHDHLMEDSVVAERLRMETLRTLPQSLASKREVKAKITRSVINKSNTKSISKVQKLKYKILMWITKSMLSFNNTMNSIELWYGSMKKIEGHFGSGVGTYFKFLRWLFSLNLFLLCISFGFIIFPQLLYAGTRDQIEYDINNDLSNGSIKQETSFHFIDLFTGKGYFTDSILFYGSYTNATIGVSHLYVYNLPYAYFMTMICMYLVTFIVVSLSMASSYRKSFIETSGGFENMYAHSIFCSWDFGISNKKAAQLKHTSIYNELKELLHDMYNSSGEESALSRFWVMSVQVTAHLLVFGMIGGIGIGLWILLQVFTKDDSDLSISTLYLAMTVNLTILIFQTIFSWIAKMEEYKSDRLALHITLMRNYLLEIVIIAVMVGFWLTNRLTEVCWETFIGQEVYRLVIVDFIIFGLGNGLLHGLRFVIYRWLYPQIGLPEFDISRGSLGLIFNEMLLLVGLFFSPPLAIIVSIKMFLIFYIKKTTLIYFCKPPSKLFRSAQTSTIFLVMTFLSLLGVVVCHGYMITRVEVSRSCGPFSNYIFMFQLFIEGVLALKEGHWFWRVVMFFTKPAFIGGILLSMCVIVYYLRSKSKARIAMVRLLKDMLYMEAKDKEFLLGNITKITKANEWFFTEDLIKSQYCPSDLYAESSSTWNYRDANTIPSEVEESSLSSINTSDSLRQRRF